jgi:hypothetical protein
MHFFFRDLGDPARLTGKNETIYGLWNITACGNNTVATGSNYDVEKSSGKCLLTTVIANTGVLMHAMKTWIFSKVTQLLNFL